MKLESYKMTAFTLVMILSAILLLLNLCSCKTWPVSVFEYEHIIYQDSTESFNTYRYNYPNDTVIIIKRGLPK